ncbi:helicase associated domain-containing protein [Streptomyces sp. NPDC087538]|uniref:helicase associated domain-containing protein n=1 Tax=Streptomyces sp. NPDC087538 TaxID=3365797 RepID=UPI00380F52F7
MAEPARRRPPVPRHLTPPAPTVGKGRRLDAWLSVQRTRRNQGRLTPQQTAALDELGIRW